VEFLEGSAWGPLLTTETGGQSHACMSHGHKTCQTTNLLRQLATRFLPFCVLEMTRLATSGIVCQFPNSGLNKYRTDRVGGLHTVVNIRPLAATFWLQLRRLLAMRTIPVVSLTSAEA